MGLDHSPVALIGLGTAVPSHRMDQTHLGQVMADSLAARPSLGRWLKHLYERSGIETRYSCLADAAAPSPRSRFAPGRNTVDTPTTAERMAIYQQAAVAIGTLAAERALADCTAESLAEVAASVTHLIAVSCTGFFAPGLDQAIARRLGLKPTVERSLIGFMGCAAAFNALRLAAQIVQARPEARVLVVCVELCTLHIQAGYNPVDLVVASLFADGAGACLVGAPTGRGDHFLIDAFYTALKPDSTEEMVWKIGDHGFTLHLSPEIPRHLGEVAPEALATLLDGRPRPSFWAIHPGGRGIVDRLAELLELQPDDLAPTMDVLRQYGNMSSPTILFVLAAMRERLRSAAAAPTGGVAMAFGPGLVAEMAHLTYLPASDMALQASLTRSVADAAVA